MGKRLFIILISIYINSCNSFFFYPSTKTYFIPNHDLLSFEELTIPGADGNPLDAWLFYPSTKPKNALIIHFHGNAQNKSAHILSTLWLTHHGFHVLSFDYRGYGRSPGSPSREALVYDGVELIKFAQKLPATQNLKKIVLGQSLGGAIGFVSSNLSDVDMDLIVLDSTFASYRDVAVKALQGSPVTWALQWLPYICISDDLSPLDYTDFTPSPYWLVIHSREDPMVPQAAIHPLLLQLPKEKLTYWELEEAGHIRAFLPNSATGMRFIRYACDQLKLKNCPKE